MIVDALMVLVLVEIAVVIEVWKTVMLLKLVCVIVDAGTVLRTVLVTVLKQFE